LAAGDLLVALVGQAVGLDRPVAQRKDGIELVALAEQYLAPAQRTATLDDAVKRIHFIGMQRDGQAHAGQTAVLAVGLAGDQRRDTGHYGQISCSAAGSRTANVLCRISGDSIIAWGSMSGMGRVMVRIAMMPAHEPGSMWPGYGPDTEQDDHQAGSNAYSTLPEDRHHAVGEQAGSQQGGQRAQAEGRHQPGRYRRIALAAGPDQGAVDQATGQPAPQRAQQDSLGQPTDRQQLACVGLEMPPEATTDSLDAR